MNKRILLIEDNPNNRYLVSFLLEARGWQMHHASDGASGLDLAARCDPAAILLDIQLPVMDGHEVARRLKADPDLSGIPIMAITSFAMQGDRQAALDAGCEAYMEKPIDPDTFVESVEALLMGA
jgi:CheY-like chemotaxis protein